jgi:hypothetical protein
LFKLKGMKRLIIIVLIALTACGSPVSEGAIIRRIEYVDANNNEAIYYLSRTDGAYFYARKGLYNVGDTIKFCR